MKGGPGLASAGRSPAPRSARALAAALLALLAAGGTGRAQPPGEPAAIAFQRLAIPDETPAHLVSALAQDRDGFLWIGTQGGLVRYDGYQFRVHKFDPEDLRSLGGSYVRTLLAGSDGRLWIGTFANGLSAYDPATETFRRYQHREGDPASLANDRVEAIAEDRMGRIWIGTYEGLDRLDPRTGELRHFRHDPGDPRSLADDLVRGLLVDRSGRLWVGSRDGLQRWLGEGKGFERRASEPGAPGSLAGQLVSKLFQDGRGRIWIGTTEHGAALLDPRENPRRDTLHRFEPSAAGRALSHFWVYGFAEVSPGEVWIATFGGGIDVVDPRTLAITHRLRHDPARDDTLGSDRIGAILRDRSGLVWIGTWGQGIDRHDPQARAFRSIVAGPEGGEGLSHPEAVRALPLPDGTVWVGTNGNGVDILDRSFRRIGGYRARPSDTGALSDGSVTCLARSEDGTIWVATLNGVLHRLRPGRSDFERITTAQGLPGGPIRTMTFGPGGELWLGSAEGLARLEPGASPPEDRITAYRHDPNDPATLSGRAAESIAFGPDGTLWVGTPNGLNAFDPKRGVAVRIPFEPGRSDGLPANWVPDLMLARDGRIWVATSGGACLLKSWDGKTATFEPVAPRLGRRPEPVDALVEDAEGKVWLGPRLRVDWKAESWQELGPADGLDLHDFFIASRARAADGTLYFGSPGGLLAIRPERLRAWDYAPPVALTALRVDGVERPGAARLRKLTLTPRERSFRLDFAALDFSAPARNLYRYRLEGYDERWTGTDAAQRTLAFNGLPPGSYRLRIRGSNRSGLWSPHEVRLPIEVLPAFYQTVWFQALTALFALALVWAGVRLRVARLEARGRQLEAQVRERTLTLEERNLELAATYRAIEEASLTDPLTRCRNRRFLEQVLPADLEIATRRHEPGAGEGQETGDADLLFFLLDLDHFKSVNDTHGHAAGDAVLVQTAEVLCQAVRTSDHLVRWGGEEFLVVARFVDRRSAPALAEKIRAAIESHPIDLPEGGTLRRTVSIGWAAYPFAPSRPRALTWQETVSLADSALYSAKREGRNRAIGFEEGAEGERDPTSWKSP